jgi:hypothetical protein
VARDQRTRLNAELAHQYSWSRRRGAKPAGKGSLTENLAAEPAHDPTPELDEQRGEQVAEQHVAAEPKKSVFELPRKEPSRPALLPEVAAPPSPRAGGAPIAHAGRAPSTPTSSRKK